MKIARHTLRDGNQEARQPAKEAFDNEESRFWVEEAPANVAEICAADSLDGGCKDFPFAGSRLECKGIFQMNNEALGKGNTVYFGFW
ncbi:hypothetical protein GOBAR_DD10803 [Gossypium barbadense]|nr:hypothetical protein GOBAR_DD10803 [Gossypium barbadense]